jgi:hypothetical protein
LKESLMPKVKKQLENDPDDDTVVLLLQVPRTNDNKELSAEQMFASLHGLLMFSPERKYAPSKRVRISFEIAVLKKRIGFYVCVPNYLKGFVEEQIYAQYPMVQISEVDDYSKTNAAGPNNTLATEMKLTANPALPIKTFQSFEVDPLAAITATLAKFAEDEEAWIQLIIKPAPDGWHKKSEKYVNSLRTTGGGMGPMSVLSAAWRAPAEAGTAAKLTEYEQARASAAEEKSHKLAYDSTLRIVFKGNGHPNEANLRLQSIVASYKQFSTTYLNGFEQSKVFNEGELLSDYSRRELGRTPLLLNIEEVATLYHLPHTTVETPYILWALSQTAEPPANLPVVGDSDASQISPVAISNFRGHNTAFGLTRNDRGRHLYILGQTGVGKSALLELLTISDIYSPYGFAVIDPHGDYALGILRRITPQRAKDVVYFNPADVDHPIAFNPMEVTDPKLITHTVSELIGVLKRMFESWGPRLEYILRYSLLALLEYPDSTMLDITRILTDKNFRKKVMDHVSDPVVKTFWTVEFESWNDKFAAEAVAPVLNKVGAFTANPLVRNIIGQPKSSFNIRNIMDERKILIVNLSRGLIGEDNAALLGSLLVTKIQLAAMSRADIPAEERTPFYLYVDEFQNFATDSFATILSEARKYGLNLTVANQYIAQMAIEVKDAVFGNVGSMIAFRMGADDARGMLRYFEPKFEEYDLVHMHNRHLVISMTINGEKSPAFSAITLDLPAYEADNTETIINNSRELYALKRSSVEEFVSDRYNLKGNVVSPPKQDNKQKQANPPTTPVRNPPKPEPIQIQPPQITDKKPEQSHKSIVGNMGQAIVKASDVEVKLKKRKRVRKRRGKRSTTESNPVNKPAVIKPTPQPKKNSSSNTVNLNDSNGSDDEHTIFLR